VVANVILNLRKDGRARMCVDFRELNKASPKGDLPLLYINVLVDNMAGYALLSFMDGYVGNN